ncbi:MAG TPA: penicillin-binding protein 1C [Steroidobacteraceae bacterium]|nr:penicillin-binding protein 1C [Steroidobacteraceae bacterium]
MISPLRPWHPLRPWQTLRPRYTGYPRRRRCGHPWRALAVALLAIVLLGAASLALALSWPVRVPDFASVRAAYTPSDAWLLDRHGTVLSSIRVRYDVRRLPWVPLASVSPALVSAMVEGEDRRFWTHHGVDWRSALGAAHDELLNHRRRGASTITMQLATLLSQRHARRGLRGWLEKLAQVRSARSLERRWTKPQILEAYLNLLGYQGELQGIGAAAAQLAGKVPAALSTPESLVLAALLPEPAADTEQVVTRACLRARTLHLSVQCETIGSTAERLLGADPAARANVFDSQLAPQLAHELLKTPGQSLRTTLDAGVQRLADGIVRSHLEALASHNVRDGAALVVDNDSGEVLAYVASGGPSSRSPAVDGVQAARQAGSTLKPFLYEMALEQRYLTAASLLADAPLSLETASGVYIPQDYDHDFKGLVSVRTALGSSLNVPAVRTLVLVGVEAFRNRLHDLGYTHITHDGEYYGYSLALGSAEVSLWQQAQAYRTLARAGGFSPISLLPTSAASRTQPLLSGGASFIVDDILADASARVTTFGLDNHLDTAFWTAAKTGTSEDMRDNWCIGFSRRFTVAVWVGNFEGDSMHDVSGVSGAAPIWHDIMVSLHAGLRSTKPSAPVDLIERHTSFAPPVEAARNEWYLRGTEAPDHIIATVPPRARPGIGSPANGMIIATDPDIPSNRQRILISVHGLQPGMRLRMNAALMGPARSEQLWTPRRGAFYLALEDRDGHTLDRVLFTVR